MSSTTHASDGRIVAERLSHALPDGRALFHDPDLSFGRRRTGLVGPNGSGKSTLVRILAGELTPSSRTVHRAVAVAVAVAAAVFPQDFCPAPEAPLTVVLGIDERLSALRRMEAGESTNHLDLDAPEALESALDDYDGALLVVSHDAEFLEAIGVERRIVLQHDA